MQYPCNHKLYSSRYNVYLSIEFNNDHVDGTAFSDSNLKVRLNSRELLFRYSTYKLLYLIRSWMYCCHEYVMFHITETFTYYLSWHYIYICVSLISRILFCFKDIWWSVCIYTDTYSKIIIGWGTHVIDIIHLLQKKFFYFFIINFCLLLDVL